MSDDYTRLNGDTGSFVRTKTMALHLSHKLAELLSRTILVLHLER